jgi:hypothetical protein
VWACSTSLIADTDVWPVRAVGRSSELCRLCMEVPLLIADLQVNVIDYLFYPGNFSADTPER